MPLPTNITLYEDVRNLLDQALASPRGLAVDIPGGGKPSGRAIYFHQRVNQFRALHRLAMLELYPEGHELRGRSPYDDLVVTREGETLTVRKAEAMTVSEL